MDKNLSFRLSILAAAISLALAGNALAQPATATPSTTSAPTSTTATKTTQLPSTLLADLAAALPGVTVGEDGQLKVGTTTLIPLLPPGYDSTKLNAKLSDFKLQADGSYVGTGNLQFVPVQSTPGSLPQLPDNFKPVESNATFATNFKPPAGFVPPTSVALPTGVTVPTKPPVALIEDMVNAGLIPKGLITFNTDGTVQATNGLSYIPFVPSADQQGKYKSGESTKVVIDPKTNVVTFPDGSVFAPLVNGTNPGDKTLPTGFKPPADMQMPKEVMLPPQFEIPKNMPLPAGVTLPAGVSIPSDYAFMIPPGTQMPAGSNIPTGVKVASDVVIPPGIKLPAGTKIDSASNLPKGTVVLPDGSMVIPGTQIPSNIKPPDTWTPPSGVTKDSTGVYYVPPPPAGGYAQPVAPKAVNANGSIVIAAPADPSKLPTGTTKNVDGTYTMPPPSFFGTVDNSGKIAAFTGIGAPSGPATFIPQTSFQSGAIITGATAPATLGTDGKVTMPAPPTGTALPAGAVQNPNGTFTVPPPSGFEAAKIGADGSSTFKLPTGAPLPPGAIKNPDGTVTMGAAPKPPTNTSPSGSTFAPPPGGFIPPGGTGTQPPGGTGTQPPGGTTGTPPPSNTGTAPPPSNTGTAPPPAAPAPPPSAPMPSAPMPSAPPPGAPPPGSTGTARGLLMPTDLDMPLPDVTGTAPLTTWAPIGQFGPPDSPRAAPPPSGMGTAREILMPTNLDIPLPDGTGTAPSLGGMGNATPQFDVIDLSLP